MEKLNYNCVKISKIKKKLRIEFLEMEGLDEQDIVRDFYIKNVTELINHNLLIFEGEIRNAIRYLVYY